MLFSLGVLGVLFRKNVIIVFMSIELMLNAVNLAFVAFAKMHGNMQGRIFVFFAITVAAAEAAVMLAIIIAVYRQRESVNTDDMDILQG